MIEKLGITPGPWEWKIEVKKGFGVYGLYNGTIQIMGDGPGWDANMCWPSEEDDRLIAAAPDMLEALYPFYKLYQTMKNMGGTFPKVGSFYSLNMGGIDEAEITIEDFKKCDLIFKKATGKTWEEIKELL